jgi:hypothetical protein
MAHFTPTYACPDIAHTVTNTVPNSLDVLLWE